MAPRGRHTSHLFSGWTATNPKLVKGIISGCLRVALVVALDVFLPQKFVDFRLWPNFMT